MHKVKHKMKLHMFELAHPSEFRETFEMINEVNLKILEYSSEGNFQQEAFLYCLQ